MHQCSKCRRFFAQYRCAAPDECDCPRCQGMCECRLEAADVATANGRALGPHADCPRAGTVLYIANALSGVRVCSACGQTSHGWWKHPDTGGYRPPNAPETVAEKAQRTGAALPPGHQGGLFDE